MRRSTIGAWIAVAVAFLAGASFFAAARANPNALWNIVHGRCVPDELRHGDPAPCAEVYLKRGAARGYAVLKDLRGIAQFLLIPTRRVTGIEDGSLLAPNVPNYFADAWRARNFVEKTLGQTLPDDDLSLAVNSTLARTQNQLHIHIDCIRADVRRALRRERAKIGEHWTVLPTPLAGHPYRAMRVMGKTLVGHDPFKLLAGGVPGARADMGKRTLVVTSATFAGGKPGFILLENRAEPALGDFAGGEELQDHSCAIGR